MAYRRASTWSPLGLQAYVFIGNACSAKAVMGQARVALGAIVE